MLRFLKPQPPPLPVQAPEDDEGGLKVTDARSRKAFLSTDLSDTKAVVSLQACPGAGKTTLVLDMMQRNHDKTFILLYYNKAMAVDAEARVKERNLVNVTVRTLDSIAYAVYKGLLTKRAPATARELDQFFSAKFNHAGARLTWSNFARSSNELPAFNPSAEENDGNNRISEVVEYAISGVKTGAWWDYSSLRKMMHIENQWPEALANYQCVVIDEAQDIKPAVMAGLSRLHGTKPVFYVGDTDQALYAYDGAVNALESLSESFTNKLVLHGSYRCGQQVCNLVNEHGWASHDMVSLTDRCTVIAPQLPHAFSASYTYLFRSNMAMLERAAITPNCYFPDFNKKVDQLLSSKRQALESALQPDWAKYLTFKRKVTELTKRVDRMRVKRRRKDQQCVVFSTVHGFKGCEADVVRLGADIMADEDRKIKLVAATRAKKMLIMT
ncbi:P-loop containing nucleoside triphosphate hydrolase protein [Tribonema minus]|uniref:P-loop containing nucleoside triphosphate hydrolase protein n=1 Tax=Tribonema minus TaxID=303371 RepID=A0A836CL43_9STRA|nr:P-loop containing nucleoside triphosphate hydrolase protein [Tribonema minus]